MTTKRIMGELVFPNGRDEAEAIGAKLEAAGFEFMIFDHPDDIDGDLPTAFMMVWRDYDGDVDRREFSTAVNAIVQQSNQIVDCVGFVQSDHIPTKFGDHGEMPAA